ncbi:MAG: outer membrane lipoprotein carrier protein LolA [Treponema sp.]|nr:outer membrane lipoprotein carrier protein LolA [Treponema sp.]
MKRRFQCVFGAVVFFLQGSVYAQSITTATDYFRSISEYYATLMTYEADVDIRVGSNDLFGHVSFKRPDLLRIDFTNPQGQVILYNGDLLTIYLPETAAVLQQQVQGDNAGSTLATPQGLSLMSRYYTVAYETGQHAVTVPDIPDEQIISLMLYNRSAAESFRSIKLAVGVDSKLIRRVEARTVGGDVFVFLFSNYVLNNVITDQRFIYDPPSSANNYNNFLFSE